MIIVQSLGRWLPQRYAAHPRVHLGSFSKIDVLAYEKDLAPALPAQDEYEVRVYDTERDQRLVAAIELVSPANKDRPEHRQAFVGKCANLLQNQVAVTIVDVVTNRAFNLYGELLDFIGQSDPLLGAEPPAVYAVACRATNPEVSRAVPGTSKPGCSPSRSASPCRRCLFGLPIISLFHWISKRAMRRPARLFVFLDLHGQPCIGQWLELARMDTSKFKLALTALALTPHRNMMRTKALGYMAAKLAFAHIETSTVNKRL